MTRRIDVLAAVAMLVAGCGSAGPSSPPTLEPPSAAPIPVPTGIATIAPTAQVVPVRLDETLVLADSREIKARCVGDGVPTILLEVGGSGDMSEWPPQFVNELGAGTTTCLYSRAGGRGSSPPAKSPASMEAVTSDAFEVLDIARATAGVEAPYVFVGWSLGGSVALANALARPDQTVGVAILDTDFPTDFLPACKASGRTDADCQAEYEDDIDAKVLEDGIARAVHPLDLPAVLVTAMAYPDCEVTPSATLSASIAGTIVVAGSCEEFARAVADLQIQRWPEALPEIRQTRLDADHDGLIRSEGRTIAELILQLVEAARTGT